MTAGSTEDRNRGSARRVVDQLCNGVLLRVICCEPGMPSHRTLYRWRAGDPEFERACAFAQAEGWRQLAEAVWEEVNAILERAGPKLARYVFALRRYQLAKRAPRFVGWPY